MKYRWVDEIVIDHPNGEILIDGEPIPWSVGLDLEVQARPSEATGLRLTIFADKVITIGNDGDSTSITTDELIEAGFNKETSHG